MDNLFNMPKKSEHVAFKMARVGDVSGQSARLVFEGERTQSQKYYKALAHASLAVGARVVCARIDSTYVIIGIL